MDNKMTTLGIASGIVSAFIFVGTWASPIVLIIALLYAAYKETDTLVKDSAKKSLYIYLIYKAIDLVLDLVRYIASMFNKTGAEGYYKTMNVIDNLVSIIFLIVVVVFAIIALVNGLPQSATPNMQYQAPAGQTPKTCPGCKTLLAGPGICPNCGTNVQ